MSIAISVKNLQKSFNQVELYRDFNLEIEQGKITALFGPNGSGKSTLLNLLAGIIKRDAGSVEIKNFATFEFSYIFQNYRESLLPWRRNFANVVLPLQVQKKSRIEIRTRVEELQKLFGFKINWRHYPYELSGGQQQLVAFMRALITRPKLLFIDEPFSALDYENNLRLRQHLQAYYVAYHPTILLITHNIEEAAHLAEKIVILSPRPTKVLEVIDNPLPYPRTVHSLKLPQFHEAKNRVLTAFQAAANL